MKKIKILSVFVILFAVMVFVSCNNESIDPAVLEGKNVEAGTFTAKIDGADFSASEERINGVLSSTPFGNQLTIMGVSSGEKPKSLSIQMSNPAIGTFEAVFDVAENLVFQYNEDAFSSDPTPFNYSSYDSMNGISVGSITITEFDTTKNKFSATFNFTGYGFLDSSRTKLVTDGVVNNITFEVIK